MWEKVREARVVFGTGGWYLGRRFPSLSSQVGLVSRGYFLLGKKPRRWFQGSVGGSIFGHQDFDKRLPGSTFDKWVMTASCWMKFSKKGWPKMGKIHSHIIYQRIKIFQVLYSFWTFLFDFEGILESRSGVWKLLLIFLFLRHKKEPSPKKNNNNKTLKQHEGLFHNFSIPPPSPPPEFLVSRFFSNPQKCHGFCSVFPTSKPTHLTTNTNNHPLWAQGRHLGSVGFCLTVSL